jgi:CRP-like cAMP-binding protein
MLQFNASEVRAGPAPPARIVRNEVLATLSPPLFEMLGPFLKSVELRRHAVLNEQNRPVDAVHFIESGVVSRLTRTSEDGSVEVAIVGRFGFIGVTVILGTMTALQRAVVQIPGHALRIPASDLKAVMAQAPEIREHLLGYVHTLMNLKAQVSLCNAKHDIEQRLARWLLLAHDRMDEGELPVTHELLATMLGVRRPGVTEALARFEQAGIVSRARGVLRVLDRKGLKANVCDCYKIIDDRFATRRAMPHFEHHLA